MTIDEILEPSDVTLALRSETKTAAIDEILTQLRGDPRVKDWEALRKTVIDRDAPALEEKGLGICIAHGRTPAVGGLVLAAGRSVDGVACPESDHKVNLIFVVGIPTTVDSEYLRIVGAIVRVCRDPKEAARLLHAKDGAKFVKVLSDAAERLD